MQMNFSQKLIVLTVVTIEIFLQILAFRLREKLEQIQISSSRCGKLKQLNFSQIWNAIQGKYSWNLGA